MITYDNIVNVRTLLSPNTNGDKTDLAFFSDTQTGANMLQHATIEHNAVAATAIAKYIEDQVDNVKKKHSNSKHTWNEEIDRQEKLL